jgi:hypothetical protein
VGGVAEIRKKIILECFLSSGLSVPCIAQLRGYSSVLKKKDLGGLSMDGSVGIREEKIFEIFFSIGQGVPCTVQLRK